MTYAILLIEDDETLSRGISYGLGREGYRVLCAATLAQAASLFSGGGIDLVICDIGLPDGSGLDFCRQVRKSSNVLFLFLTAMDAEMDFVQGYDAGADDYMPKPFSMLVLTSKVAAMLGRLPQKEPQAVHSGEITFYPEEGRVEKRGTPLELTPNEWRLLGLFLDNPRRVLSKRKLLDTLWQTDSDYLDENNVAVSVRRLREKIKDDPSTPLYIKNVRGIGYLWNLECGAR